MESNTIETALIDQELEHATAGLEPYFLEHLKTKVCYKNSLIIVQYINSMRIETNLSDNHRRGVITSLKLLSEYLNNKNFINMTKADVLSYLDSLRKPDEVDTLHKWISTYNQRLVIFIRFFKWLYYSNSEPSKRQKPQVINNIPTIKRKEKSSYHPSDLWTDDDHAIFLRYGLNKRDRSYHAMAIDTSCRPHELLKLKIKDIVFKLEGDRQYAEIVVNGKTGTRAVPLFNSIPFLKDWLQDHPHGRNPSALLFCELGKRMGRQLSRYAIYNIYERYKKIVFPSLLEHTNVPKQDKE